MKKTLIQQVFETQNSDLTNTTLVSGLEIKSIKKLEGHEDEDLLRGELFYKGTLMAIVQDDFYNGPFDIDTINSEQEKLYQELNKAYEERKVSYTFLNQTFEVSFYRYIERLLRATNLTNKVQRARKKTYFYVPEENQNMTINATLTDEIEQHILQDFPTAIIFKKD